MAITDGRDVTHTNRRAFLRDAASLTVLALVGCTTAPEGAPVASTALLQSPFGGDPNYALMYAAIPGEKFPVAAIDLTKVNPAFLRREVAYPTPEKPGMIVVDPTGHYLYYILPGGKAVRYGVGVGKEGFEWNGVATINSKQEWPDWYPPAEMIERRPDIKGQLVQLQSGLGVAGGLRNPIGARGLYLWQNGKDTLYRIHGTIEPHTIGQSVSSGCIRMINQDVIDLYARVPVGTEVKVLPAGASVVTAAL
jgi:lipoprotein-anchoring transpeptidase ErfK/SrfK